MYTLEHAFVAAIRAYYSNGVDFIEPLDVSTIFGNGLDNAIEASEKLLKNRGRYL